ncbi:hypothetical protein AY599_15575 [Leptolyngbya valderiana BDU 20041]|nr:hypothetical protein AY599_15575 [Leptolyngbya valderiana BDU 20041]
MFDSFSRAVAEAEAQTTYVEPERLDRLRQFVAARRERLDAVSTIRQKAKSIVTRSVSSMVAENPHLIQEGGNCYPMSRMATCLRDGEFILRYISYALLAGDASVLDECCLYGLKETYDTLGVPRPSAIRAIAVMKNATLDALETALSDVDVSIAAALSAEVSHYFDRAAIALS